MLYQRLSVAAAGLVLMAATVSAQTCPGSVTNASNFNGTSIQPGSYVWFNANFTASGIPSTGATIFFRNSSIALTADTTYTVAVPDARVTFDPAAICSSTSFDTLTNAWVTTVPLAGSDETFLSGVAFPVPASFTAVNGRVSGPVVWQGEFSSTTSGISVNWKWSAAVYSAFSADYSALQIKPTHTGTCLSANSDHAGTPEGVNPATGKTFKSAVVGGARGGGGSNWTGSWSGTQGVSVCVVPPVPIRL